jgi:MFS family permease
MSKSPAQPLKPGFALLFALAHAGAFAGCLPVLTILVPLKAAEIDPLAKAALLSWTVLFGALAASVVNIAAGALSDKTKSRFGRRRPWILVGALATVATYALIAGAGGPLGLFAAVMLFQVAFNLFLPALVALLPDQVPDARKGMMAAFLALGPPIGLGVGAVLAGAEGLSAAGRYVAVAAVFIGSIAPLLIFWKEPPRLASAAIETVQPTSDRAAWDNFAKVWTSRLLIQIAVATTQGYMLFFLGQTMTARGGFPDLPPESLLGALLFLSTSISIAMALAVGVVSDMIGRRKYFVTASAFLIFLGMATFALWPTWPGVLVCQALYGLGMGLYSSAEVALAAELLPSRENAARDLAILNLGNTLPQAIAPVLALVVISLAGGGYSVLFLSAASAAAIGGVVAARIRTTR